MYGLAVVLAVMPVPLVTVNVLAPALMPVMYMFVVVAPGRPQMGMPTASPAVPPAGVVTVALPAVVVRPGRRKSALLELWRKTPPATTMPPVPRRPAGSR